MEDQDRGLIAEEAVAAANALDRQQGVFGFGTLRPDRFPSCNCQSLVDCEEAFCLGRRCQPVGRRTS